MSLRYAHLLIDNLRLRFRSSASKRIRFFVVTSMLSAAVLDGCNLGHNPDLPSVEEKEGTGTSFRPGDSGADGTTWIIHHPTSSSGDGDGDGDGYPGSGGSLNGEGGMGGLDGIGGEGLGGEADW